MEHKCPHCGVAINPAQMLGSVKSPKKEAAAKANGERLRKMFANARKLEVGGIPRVEMTREYMQSQGMDSRFIDAVAPIPPKPTTLEAKKAAALKALELAAGPGRFKHPVYNPAGPDLHETPHAPFKLNLEGEPHRVTQMGKRLGLFYLGGGEPTFTRYLEPGELEKFWEARIK